MKKTKHDRVMDFIKVIRHSFHDSVVVYRYGGCYGFYQILKHVFPIAEAYFPDDEYDHVITKIDGKFYEIKGERFPKKEHPPIKFEKDDHEHWQEVAYGQRLEEMLYKYRNECNQIKS